MSGMNKEQRLKLQLIDDLRYWCEFLLARGINPRFVVEGLTAEESEQLFEEAQRLLEAYK